MFTRSTLVLVAVALPLAAQHDQDIATAASTRAGTATFYKAYFLDKEKARSKKATAQAIELYTRFIAANGDHALAGRAASNCVVLLYSSGNFEKARAFGKTHAALIKKSDAATRAARENRAGGEANSDVIAKLREAMQDARDDGNNEEVARITLAMRRVGGRSGRGRGGFGGGRGGFGGGRGGRAGRGRGGIGEIPKLKGMKPAEAKAAVEKLVANMERTIDFMAQRGQADQADKLEAKLDKLQDLVDDGKLEDAQKLLDGLQEEMRGAFGGRGRGGNQGGRRRRGGDGGDQGGRRRRGGDGGDQGGRRRRGGNGEIK